MYRVENSNFGGREREREQREKREGEYEIREREREFFCINFVHKKKLCYSYVLWSSGIYI